MRKILYLVVSLSVISLLILTGCDSTTDPSSTPPNAEDTMTTVATTTAPTASAGKITLEQYNQVEEGMSYDEVKEILGSEGTLLSEVGEKGTELYTAIYRWFGYESAASSANFTFQGDKMELKVQIGLK